MRDKRLRIEPQSVGKVNSISFRLVILLFRYFFYLEKNEKYGRN